MHTSETRISFGWSEEILVKFLLRKHMHSLENCFNINLPNILSIHETNMIFHSNINHIAVKFGIEMGFGEHLIATCVQGELWP